MDSRHREEILRLLEQNARYTAKDIAVMLGMDVIEVKNEIEIMERERTICGYHALVDLMSGGYDFSVILKKATMKEIANFVSSRLAVIEEVQSTATHIVLVRYKDHGILLAAPKKDMRMVVTP